MIALTLVLLGGILIGMGLTILAGVVGLLASRDKNQERGVTLRARLDGTLPLWPSESAKPLGEVLGLTDEEKAERLLDGTFEDGEEDETV